LNSFTAAANSLATAISSAFGPGGDGSIASGRTAAYMTGGGRRRPDSNTEYNRRTKFQGRSRVMQKHKLHEHIVLFFMYVGGKAQGHFPEKPLLSPLIPRPHHHWPREAYWYALGASMRFTNAHTCPCPCPSIASGRDSSDLLGWRAKVGKLNVQRCTVTCARSQLQ
jgi:hypothetical protein